MGEKKKKQKTEIINDAWTTRELRAYIRKETQNMNYRLLDYYENVEKPNPLVTQIKANLVKLGTGKEIKNGFIGLGLTYKTKAELIRQARALQQSLKIDIYSTEGKRQYKEKEEKQFKAFINNRPALKGMSQDDYHDMVEAFGALGNHVLESFGYEELANLYHSAKTNQKIDFVSIIVDMQKETKGAGLDQTQLIDRLREKLLN